MQYYLKEGKRFIPANDPHALDGLNNGMWLVEVKEGSTACTTLKDAEYAKLDAALYEFKEALLSAMSKESQLKPKATKLSKKEQRAWKAYEDIMGKDMPQYFYYSSLDAIAKAGCEVIRKRMIERDPTLKDDTLNSSYKPDKKPNSMAYIELNANDLNK